MWIKKFIKFKNSINESLFIFYDSLLKAINAKEVEINRALDIDSNTDLVALDNDSNFIKLLAKNNMKKSSMELSSDYETFLNSPCRFMFISNINASDLDNPIYLLLQPFDSTLNKWEETNCYKIQDNIKKFYDQLSSKIIEITDGADKFIYQTSNKNSWDLTSVKETDDFKRTLSKEDLENVIKNRKAQVKVV